MGERSMGCRAVGCSARSGLRVGVRRFRGRFGLCRARGRDAVVRARCAGARADSARSARVRVVARRGGRRRSAHWIRHFVHALGRGDGRAHAAAAKDRIMDRARAVGFAGRSVRDLGSRLARARGRARDDDVGDDRMRSAPRLHRAELAHRRRDRQPLRGSHRRALGAAPMPRAHAARIRAARRAR